MDREGVLKLRLGDNLKVDTRFGEGFIVGLRATEQLVGYPLSDEIFVYFKDGIRVDGQVKTKFYWLSADKVKLLTKVLTDKERLKLYKKSEFNGEIVDAKPDAKPKLKLKDKKQTSLF